MSHSKLLALFGEAERGQLHRLYFCNSIMELYQNFGEPPVETQGLYYAVQSLLFGHPLLFMRIHEEGRSEEDYLLGLELLKELPERLGQLEALFLPGVGSGLVIHEGIAICNIHHSILIMNEKDFYDYLTEKHPL